MPPSVRTKSHLERLNVPQASEPQGLFPMGWWPGAGVTLLGAPLPAALGPRPRSVEAGNVLERWAACLVPEPHLLRSAQALTGPGCFPNGPDASLAPTPTGLPLQLPLPTLPPDSPELPFGCPAQSHHLREALMTSSWPPCGARAPSPGLVLGTPVSCRPLSSPLRLLRGEAFHLQVWASLEAQSLFLDEGNLKCFWLLGSQSAASSPARPELPLSS